MEYVTNVAKSIFFKNWKKYKSYQPPLKQMPKLRLDHCLGECTRNYFVPALLARNARGHKNPTTQIKPNKNKKNH